MGTKHGGRGAPAPSARTIKTPLAERGPAEQGTVLLQECQEKRQWGSNEAVRTEPEKVALGAVKTWVRAEGGLRHGEHGTEHAALAWVPPGCATNLHLPTGPPCELGA